MNGYGTTALGSQASYRMQSRWTEHAFLVNWFVIASSGLRKMIIGSSCRWKRVRPTQVRAHALRRAAQHSVYRRTYVTSRVEGPRTFWPAPTPEAFGVS